VQQVERNTTEPISRDELWQLARKGKDGKYSNQEVENVVENIVSILGII
jgi:hypothetical protein